MENTEFLYTPLRVYIQLPPLATSPTSVLYLLQMRNLHQYQQKLFTSGGQSIGSFSFSINPSNEYSGFISFRMDWLDLLAVQETQASSPTPQFRSINSLVLSLLYSPTLTPIHDYWKNHSFDNMDLCYGKRKGRFLFLKRHSFMNSG